MNLIHLEWVWDSGIKCSVSRYSSEKLWLKTIFCPVTWVAVAAGHVCINQAVQGLFASDFIQICLSFFHLTVVLFLVYNHFCWSCFLPPNICHLCSSAASLEFRQTRPSCNNYFIFPVPWCFLPYSLVSDAEPPIFAYWASNRCFCGILTCRICFSVLNPPLHLCRDGINTKHDTGSMRRLFQIPTNSSLCSLNVLQFCSWLICRYLLYQIFLLYCFFSRLQIGVLNSTGLSGTSLVIFLLHKT